MAPFFMIAALLAAPPAHANGQTTHLWISETAIDHLETEALHTLLVTHRGSMRVGTMFPDGGYAIGHEYGEHAHWEPFQDRYRDWILSAFDGPDDPDAGAHIAFYLGLASHGMADQVFDSMYMERSRIYDAEFGWADPSKSLDTSQDVVFADRTQTQAAPSPELPSILPELFAEAGIDVDMQTLEDGQGWLTIAVDGVAGMSQVSTLVDAHMEAFPWGCSHLLDESVPGSPPFEARVVAAYWESLWADLHDRPAPLTVIGSWPDQGAEGHPTGASDVEARLSVVFNRSLTVDAVTPERFRVRSGDAAVPTLPNLFYGDDSHVVNVAPEVGWVADAVHEFTIDGLTATDGRRLDAPHVQTFNTGVAADGEGGGTAEGCQCSAGRGRPEPWLAVLPLLMARRWRRRCATSPPTG
ncbi:MAG: hypothetical protein VX944_08550 [Myxococcota bacterium]|nr:hypothetical protein [Myxococcota bacterium]